MDAPETGVFCDEVSKNSRADLLCAVTSPSMQLCYLICSSPLTRRLIW